MGYILKHIDVVSAVKVNALIGAILSFLLGIVYGGLSVILPLLSGNLGAGALAGGALCIGSLIAFPLAGAIFGALFGLVYAFIYNLVAQYIGGIELVLNEKPGQAVNKPLPQQEKKPQN